jgi:hypothetical protein
LSAAEQRFLSPVYAHPKAKNISLNRQADTLRCGDCTDADQAYLKALMLRFSDHATQLVKQLLQPYANHIELGRTSLRVVEIAGRTSSYRKDDTRLHVDAFPATPNQGRRLLRVFTNVNLEGKPRVWRVGEPFAAVVQRFLPQVPKQSRWLARALQTLKITKSYRTEYDHIMLQIHDRMKADRDYQRTVPQTEIQFAPGSTWIVQTDHVSHAAMRGQHLLEQTFYLPVDAMLNEKRSPLRTLEACTARPLV